MELGVRIAGVGQLGKVAESRVKAALPGKGSRAVGLERGTLLLLREEDVEEAGPEVGEAAGPPFTGAGARAFWPSAVALRDLAW